MSIEAYNRTIAREQFWSPFIYSFPFTGDQTIDRNIIFGLYSGSYINQYTYLEEVESQDLSNLLNDYNTKLAELTTQEQRVVADIISRRYLAGIDKLIHDQKMVTKQSQINAESLEWDAKIAALSADQAALETMHAKVISEIAKTTAKITELEAYIAIEGYNLNMVDVEIAEKEIQSAKVDLQVMETQNEILKIQIQIVQSSIALIGVDEEIARTKISTAEINKGIAKMPLYWKEVDIAISQTTIAQLEVPLAVAKAALATAEGLEIDAEKIFYDQTMIAQEETAYNNKKDLADKKDTLRTEAIKNRDKIRSEELKEQKSDSDLLDSLATSDSDSQKTMDTARADVYGNSSYNYGLVCDAAVTATQKLALAKISTELTHTIGKKA